MMNVSTETKEKNNVIHKNSALQCSVTTNRNHYNFDEKEMDLTVLDNETAAGVIVENVE